MASCGKCLHKEVCVDYRYYKPIAEKCQHFKEFNVDKKPQTNADIIRVMNDEALSMFLWRFDREELARESDCVITRTQILKWLQSHAEKERE